MHVTPVQKPPVLRLLACLIALAPAACSGGGNSSSTLYAQPPPVSSQLAQTCSATSGAKIQEVYPAVGASGVTNQPANVILAASAYVQASGYIILVPNGLALTQDGYAFGGIMKQSSTSLPSGTATPAIVNPVYYASPNKSALTLPTNVLISVYFADNLQNCNPALLGTFNT